MPRTTLLVAVTATSEPGPDGPAVRLNESYVRALEGAGLVPLVVPPLADPTRVALVLDVVAGLVLTGGEDVDPALYGAPPHAELGPLQRERDATEIALAREAQRRSLPTLAICRGAQLLAVAFGGSLVQDIPSQRPGTLSHELRGAWSDRTHDVRVTAGSTLAGALGATELAVNTSHHQEVAEVPPELAITARAPDGVAEGIEWTGPEWWAVGVQWHPEELVGGAEPWDRRLFAAFADECAAARERNLRRQATGGGG